MVAEGHCVLAGKGDVQQLWVQGKEMPRTYQAAPLCHCCKAEPKGPGAGSPSLRLPLFLTLLQYCLFPAGCSGLMTLSGDHYKTKMEPDSPKTPAA